MFTRILFLSILTIFPTAYSMNCSKKAFDYARLLLKPCNIVHVGVFLSPWADSFFKRNRIYNNAGDICNEAENANPLVTSQVHSILETQGVQDLHLIKVKMLNFSPYHGACAAVETANGKFILLNRVQDPETGNLIDHPLEQAITELNKIKRTCSPEEIKKVTRDFYHTNQNFLSSAFTLCHEGQRLNTHFEHKVQWGYALAPLCTQALFSVSHIVLGRQRLIATLLQSGLISGIFNAVGKTIVADAGLSYYLRKQELQRDAAISASPQVLFGGLKLLTDMRNKESEHAFEAYIELEERLEEEFPQDSALKPIIKSIALSLIASNDISPFSVHATKKERSTLLQNKIKKQLDALRKE